MKKEKFIIVFLLLVFPILSGCGGFSSINMSTDDNSLLSSNTIAYPVEELIYQDAQKTYSENYTSVASPEKNGVSKNNEKLLLNYKLEEAGGNIITDSSDNHISLSFENILWKKSGIDISKLSISTISKKFEKIVLNNSIFDEDENIELIAIIKPVNNIDINSYMEFTTKNGSSKKSIDDIIDNISSNFYINPKYRKNIEKINLNSKKSYFISLKDGDGVLKFYINEKLLFEIQSLNDNSLHLLGFLKKFKYKLPIIIDSVKLYSVGREI